MDNILWKKVEAYNFDFPISEYGFSTRLAYENNWTINYTQKAILEYKKFMFLAATSSVMVSPSAIVDIVWHQHLIFTQLYNKFCDVLGKRIEHIPSTHNRAEKEKFAQAKESTRVLYEGFFGKQPEEFWNYDNLSDIFLLDKSKYDFNQYLQFSIGIFILLFLPFCYIIRPVYLAINNPFFVIGYIGIIIFSLLFLYQYNQNFLNNFYSKLSFNTVIKSLTAMELIYMKAGKLDNVIHGYVNQLIVDEFVSISADKKVNNLKNKEECNPFEKVIMDELKSHKNIQYSYILNKMRMKPVFIQIKNSANHIDRVILNSKQFSKLLVLNYAVIFTLFLIGCSRMAIGFQRGKPIFLLVLISVFLIFISFIFLRSLKGKFTTAIIPEIYNKLVKSSVVKNDFGSWEWQYFLLGSIYLGSSFAPIIINNNNNNNSSNGDSSSSSSCGCSCGSSCGSSCGGCGGD